MCGASVSNKIDTARLSGWHGESTRLPIETQPTPHPQPIPNHAYQSHSSAHGHAANNPAPCVRNRPLHRQFNCT